MISARDDNGRSLLHWACSGGHKELVQWLLESGSEVDARDDSRWTPLIIASSAGHEAVVRLLLGAGANINAICSKLKDTNVLNYKWQSRLGLLYHKENSGNSYFVL